MNFLVISSRTFKCLSGVLFVFTVERVFRPVLASFYALVCILIYVIFYTYTQGHASNAAKKGVVLGIRHVGWPPYSLDVCVYI